ncbi:DUF397 domain-containing protein [Streptomyces sp. NPDC049577]|uniref:DUF397 domain-containing protein n=1 Tax=Streptomyces sp. NPDC049577 TaxID=3155153 RepID=UPI00341BB013
MSQLAWHKSSFSTGGNNNCVELVPAPGGLIRLRESDHPSTIVAASPSALAAFLRHIRAAR